MWLAYCMGNDQRISPVKPSTPYSRWQPRPLTLAGLCAVMAGCASILTGADQAVTVQVMCKGRPVAADCQVSNSKGRWNFQAPQTRMILRDSAPLRVACYSSVTGEYGVYQYPGVNPASVGNAVVGGLVGTAVDASNTKLWAYPSVITIENDLCKRMPS